MRRYFNHRRSVSHTCTTAPSFGAYRRLHRSSFTVFTSLLYFSDGSFLAASDVAPLPVSQASPLPSEPHYASFPFRYAVRSLIQTLHPNPAFILVRHLTPSGFLWRMAYEGVCSFKRNSGLEFGELRRRISATANLFESVLFKTA